MPIGKSASSLGMLGTWVSNSGLKLSLGVAVVLRETHWKEITKFTTAACCCVSSASPVTSASAVKKSCREGALPATKLAQRGLSLHSARCRRHCPSELLHWHNPSSYLSDILRTMQQSSNSVIFVRAGVLGKASWVNRNIVENYEKVKFSTD